MTFETPPRLRGRSPIAGPRGLVIHRAQRPWARVLGLAGLEAMPATSGLLLEGTRSVHTFGMRFALDLVWLRDRCIVQVDRGVGPRRLRSCRAADAVLELAAGQAAAAGLAVGARLPS